MLYCFVLINVYATGPNAVNVSNDVTYKYMLSNDVCAAEFGWTVSKIIILILDYFVTCIFEEGWYKLCEQQIL